VECSKQIVYLAIKHNNPSVRNSYIFWLCTSITKPSTQYFKYGKNGIHVYSPYGFTL